MSEQKPKIENPSEDISKQKRNVLKGIIASGGILSADAMVKDKWTTPIVDSVMLPAHAVQTAGGGDEGAGEQSITYFDVISRDAMTKSELIKDPASEKSFAERVLDQVIPQAKANHQIGQFNQLYICVTVTGTAFLLNITRDAGEGGIFNYATSGTVGVISMVSGVANQCPDSSSISNGFDVLVENPTDSNVSVTLNDTSTPEPIVALINRANCVPFMGTCPPREQVEP